MKWTTKQATTGLNNTSRSWSVDHCKKKKNENYLSELTLVQPFHHSNGTFFVFCLSWNPEEESAVRFSQIFLLVSLTCSLAIGELALKFWEMMMW
jgi:hypothetical protein